MSWEQIHLPLFAEPPQQQQPPQPVPPRAIPRREPDEFDAWVHRRIEFDKAFLRGLRMSSEQTMIDNKSPCRAAGRIK